ncbi:MAG: nucleotide sugar dehydrogenase [Paracoccaceae bacterium]
MRVSILGAGYVGAVSGACLAECGHGVTVVDVDRAKVDLIANGQAPIVEKGLSEMIAANVDAGRLTATSDLKQAVADTDVSIVCVGTPSRPNGDLDLRFVETVCAQIGEAVASKSTRHTVIIRSTMLPGSMRGTVIPTLERASGLTYGDGFGLAIYPEFLRESTAIDDFFAPAIMLLGVDDDKTLEVLREINAGIESTEIVTEIDTAEAVKYANNAWHAVKLTFANEIGNICKAAQVDGQKVMDIVCMDTRLNISRAYLRPGYAFGGSCLPKDLRALRYKASSMDVRTPMFDGVMEANSQQVEKSVEMVTSKGGRKVALLGLAFKAGTDDLRESPLVELAERLLGKGYDLKIYDKNVEMATLRGSNLAHIQAKLSHLSQLMTDDLEGLIAGSDTIIIGNGDKSFVKAVEKAGPEQQVIDLIRVDPDKRTGGNYDGICW